MEMRTFTANSMRELEQKVNDAQLKKEDIINIMQASNGIYYLTYFAEE